MCGHGTIPYPGWHSDNGCNTDNCVGDCVSMSTESSDGVAQTVSACCIGMYAALYNYHVQPNDLIVASVAQLDAPSDWRPGGRGFNPAKVGNIFLWRLIMKYFLRSFSPFG